jgi:hypothetical protein
VFPVLLRTVVLAGVALLLWSAPASAACEDIRW